MELGNKWALNIIKFTTIESEKAFCHDVLSKIYNNRINLTNNWSSVLGETLVRDCLVKRHNQRIIPFDNRLRPDFVTNDFIVEVKTRNFNTSGTAGEKILFPSLKYMDIVNELRKPLLVVLVGYQEIEARDKFGMFKPENKIINFLKTLNIHYICYSDFINTDLGNISYND